MRRTARPSIRPWTFLVYMAGDNDLEECGVDDLGEMKKVGSTDGVNVVVQFDRPSGCTRYYLRKGTTLAKDVVATLGPKNTGDPAALIDCIGWAVKSYPAERYAVVLWNHGQGWDDTDIFRRVRGPGRDMRRPGRIGRALFRTSVEQAARLTTRAGPAARAILIDDSSMDFLDNLEMKKVLTATRKLLGKKLDLLGMDACLMSMAEVGHQVRSSVSFTVGSEETEPGDGWPYDAVLRALTRDPAVDGEKLGRLIVTEYLRSYASTGEAVTQSVCNLADSRALATAVAQLATALRSALPASDVRTSLLEIRQRVQQYYVRDNVDLVDLCRLLCEARTMPEDVKTAAAAVEQTALAGTPPPYVVHSGYLGRSMEDSTGVAIYFPTRVVSPLYSRLDWERATGWGGFLQAFIDSTRGR